MEPNSARQIINNIIKEMTKNRDTTNTNTNNKLDGTSNNLLDHQHPTTLINKKLLKSTDNIRTQNLKNMVAFNTFIYQNSKENKNIWNRTKLKINQNFAEKKIIYEMNYDEKEKTNILSAYKENGVYIIYKEINHSKNIVAKIKWNFFSNNFKIYNENDFLGEIVYNFNFKGWNGPTKLHILLPDENFIKTNNMYKMVNKLPEYNGFYKSYVLDFADRKIIPNEKNIQIIFSGEENNILLQFAQVGIEEYILDFKYPFNKITAFAVALTDLSTRTFFQ